MFDDNNEVRLPPNLIKSTIRLILQGLDHRKFTYELITWRFLQDTVEFFRRIVSAKFENRSIDVDWYKESFLTDRFSLDKAVMANLGGTSVKTVTNKRQTSKREIVVEEALESYGSLLNMVSDLCESDADTEISLTITYNQVSVSLTLNESLVVINALALRRNSIRGGSMSSLGKQIEKPLLITMCMLFSVPKQNYSSGNRRDVREIDFVLRNKLGQEKKCEVKLMGKGNPEGADSTFARDSNVFIASKLSDTNIRQLQEQGVEWVELNKPFGFLRFEEVLGRLSVPHKKLNPNDNVNELIEDTLNQLEI